MQDTAAASDVEILIVTRVPEVQLRFAKRMVAANDVCIQAAVIRVLEVQLPYVQRTAVASAADNQIATRVP